MFATTPINRLSADVLLFIFDAVQDPPRHQRHIRASDWNDTRSSPSVVVSQVSQSWRRVATSSPLLWTNINISTPWNLDVIQSWLTRSNSCPIDIAIRMSGAKSKQQIETEMKHSFEPFSDIIASCVPRCRSISAFADKEHNKWLCDLGWALHDVHAPLLERFLWWGEGDVPQIGLSHHSEPLFNNEVPVLRDVRCTCAYLTLYQPPWNQITTLHLDGFGDSKTMPLILFSTIISECTSLDTLVMYGSVHQSYHLKETFILPSLRSLQFYGGTNLDVLAFSAPLLEELILVPMRRQHLGSQFALATVRPHGSVLFPLLRSLTLSLRGDIQALRIELEFAFECFPDIEQLTLIGRNNETLDALLGTNLFWPKLRSLALKDVSEDDTFLLSDLISFRRENSCPLAQIQLDSTSLHQMPGHILESVRSHVDVQEEDVWVTLHQDNLYAPDGYLYNSGA